MFEGIIVVVCLVGIWITYCHDQDMNPPRCSVCGEPLRWFEGMGAGFYRCMSCELGVTRRG